MKSLHNENSSRNQIYMKRGKYIDEAVLFNNINIRKYIIIISVILLCFAFFQQNIKMGIILFIILLFSIYFHSKGIFYKEGFYDGYDCGNGDAFEEAFQYPGVKELVEKNMGIKKSLQKQQTNTSSHSHKK